MQHWKDIGIRRMDEQLLTAREAAEILKVKKNTVYDMIKRGDLRAAKLGKQLRIRREDLLSYIEHGSQKSEGEAVHSTGSLFAKMKDSGEEPFVICGQDIVLDVLANALNGEPYHHNAVRSYKGSYNALYAMYQGEADVATCHLWHGKTDTYNLPYVESMLPGTDLAVYHLLKRNQGFYVKKGNPKGIFTFADLKKPEITIVNREPGSGSRVLMDEKLRKEKICPSEISGYHNIVTSHLQAACAVAGEADAALGTEKYVNQVPGIEFVFVQEESYDLVIRKEDLMKKVYQDLLKVIRDPVFQGMIHAMDGYNISGMGERIL